MNIAFNWLYDLWQIPNVKAVVITIIIGILLDILRRIFVPKGRIAWGISHEEHFILPPQQLPPPPPEQPPLPLPLALPQSINVRIRQIFIQNIGRAIAEDVEVTINFLPQHWHAFPPLAQMMPNTQDRFFRLHTKMLNKREHFIISMFESRGNMVLPDVLTVRWKGGVAKQVPMVPRQKFPTWFERSVVAAVYFGIFAAVFVILRATLFILG